MNENQVLTNRIETLRRHIDEILLNMEDAEERRCAYVHLYGVAQSCVLIALKRGENAELAAIAGMLHDIYVYAKMDAKDHAHKGAVLAREILTTLKITSDDETRMICDAIYTHSEKETTQEPFNELLVDADVWQHYLYNPTLEVKEAERNRCQKLKSEFGIV